MKSKNARILVWTLAAIILVIGAFFLITYRKFSGLNEKYVNISPGQEQSIVLVNVGEKDREWIANRLVEAARHNPAVITIDLFFKDYNPKDPADSMLLSVIANLKAILAAKHNGDSIIGIHPKSMQAASSYGFANLLPTDNYVTHFPVYYRGPQKIDYAFSLQIAKEIDSVAASKYLKSLKTYDQQLVMTKLGSQFDIIEVDDELTESRIKDKVVILGYLGPTNEDKHTTYARFYIDGIDHKLNEPDTYGPVIVANEVLQILSPI